MDDEDEESNMLDVDESVGSSSPRPSVNGSLNGGTEERNGGERAAGSISSPDPSIADHSMSSEQ